MCAVGGEGEMSRDVSEGDGEGGGGVRFDGEVAKCFSCRGLMGLVRVDVFYQHSTSTLHSYETLNIINKSSAGFSMAISIPTSKPGDIIMFQNYYTTMSTLTTTLLSVTIFITPIRHQRPRHLLRRLRRRKPLLMMLRRITLQRRQRRPR